MVTTRGQKSEVKGQKLLIEERAKKFAIDIIKLVKEFPKTTEAFIIGKQLIRSATSISANLAEGAGAVSEKDFLNFRCISRKSALETRNWLELSEGAGLAKSEKIKPLLDEIEEIIKILSSIILKLKSKK